MRTALVTGGTGRVGRAVAARLENEGFRVLAAGRRDGDLTSTAAARALVDRVRAAGGTVVASGGCFDLLHAGHSRALAAARALGDCLVVLLNSDASVRRLKGPQRPVTPAAERAELLAALGCVDAVVVFEEDDPCTVLGGLRPDLWVKGGDYSGLDLAEADVVRRHGGQAVVLPYLDGHSTTALVARAREMAAR